MEYLTAAHVAMVLLLASKQLMKLMVAMGCITITKPILTAFIYYDGSSPSCHSQTCTSRDNHAQAEIDMHKQKQTPDAKICITWKNKVALQLLLVTYKQQQIMYEEVMIVYNECE